MIPCWFSVRGGMKKEGCIGIGGGGGLHPSWSWKHKLHLTFKLSRVYRFDLTFSKTDFLHFSCINSIFNGNVTHKKQEKYSLMIEGMKKKTKH